MFSPRVPPHISRTHVLPPLEHCNYPRKFIAHVFCHLLNTAIIPRTFLAHSLGHPLNTARLPRTFLAHVFVPPFENRKSHPHISRTRCLPSLEHCDALPLLSPSLPRGCPTAGPTEATNQRRHLWKRYILTYLRKPAPVDYSTVTSKACGLQQGVCVRRGKEN